MIVYKTTILNISLSIATLLLFPLGLIAYEDNIYRYNALENKINFAQGNNEVKNKIPQEIEIIVDKNTEKLKNTIKEQNISIEKTEDVMNKINNRTALRTFLIGNKLGALKFQIVQMKEQDHILNNLASNIEDTETENQIKIQIDVSEKQQKKIEDYILEQDEKFSLFGWLANSL